jgi:hypothetical protein
MTCALVLYVCLGTPAGYVAARYPTFNFYLKTVFVFLLYIVVHFLLCLLFISLTPHWECTVLLLQYCTLQYFFSIEYVFRFSTYS